jgi:hypothetical protein
MTTLLPTDEFDRDRLLQVLKDGIEERKIEHRETFRCNYWTNFNKPGTNKKYKRKYYTTCYDLNPLDKNGEKQETS